MAPWRESDSVEKKKVFQKRNRRGGNLSAPSLRISFFFFAMYFCIPSKIKSATSLSRFMRICINILNGNECVHVKRDYHCAWRILEWRVIRIVKRRQGERFASKFDRWYKGVHDTTSAHTGPWELTGSTAEIQPASFQPARYFPSQFDLFDSVKPNLNNKYNFDSKSNYPNKDLYAFCLFFF